MRLISSTATPLAVAALFVLNAAVSIVAQGVDLCRCTAKFEHFYDRRSLIQQPPSENEEEDRSLAFSNYAYDYKNYYIDDAGYYVVEGVRVLPDDDPACDDSADDEVRTTSSSASSDTTPATTPYKRDGILARVFGQGRSLYEPDEEDEQDLSQAQQLRTLMGMMSGGSGKGSSSSDGGSDDYYNYGGDAEYSKGKVRVSHGTIWTGFPSVLSATSIFCLHELYLSSM